MIELRRLRPSASYEIHVPIAVHDDRDDRVTNFWIDGSPVVLQLSSYLRPEGPQLPARDRLLELIAREPGQWQEREAPVHPASVIDQAAAEHLASDGILWLHVYLVWPHLTVYATVSGPPVTVHDENNWALMALRSVELAVH